MHVLDALRQRRAVRAYNNEPVPAEERERLPGSAITSGERCGHPFAGGGKE
ncbi:hypothetical protein GTO89_13140 [Heliobacterium gestii]|uniref:Nitroreductase domain-containing protein n=1 Tax=Heliomicrobium gestii TaxID=2699 RepID=A0A845LB23_HELGE|nr:hypothetical protein [Heliomicrobium gestii]MBM7867474.1 nitroreductase [Heliomicrobium gestii]MZP43977.1 hypothetical protein [Heliomicrobium gestii]